MRETEASEMSCSLASFQNDMQWKEMAESVFPTELYLYRRAEWERMMRRSHLFASSASESPFSPQKIWCSVRFTNGRIASYLQSWRLTLVCSYIIPSNFPRLAWPTQYTWFAGYYMYTDWFAGYYVYIEEKVLQPPVSQARKAPNISVIKK